ncbi:MAG: hypothetical protein WA140_01610 [Geobacteraceae bacterium]
MVSTQKSISRLIPSIASILFIVLFIYIAFNGKGLLGDADTGYHIRAGEYILAHHAIPRHDIFSFHSPPIPWTAHEWLSEVIMALVHGAFGMTGLVIFFAFLIALVYCLLFKYLRSYSSNILAALFIALMVMASSMIHWLARPHIFSYLLILFWYFILDAHERGTSKRLWTLPLIMLLWVNLHGGFVVGFILLGAYFTGNLIQAVTATGEAREEARRRYRQLVSITVLCLAACLVNPFGYHILLFPFNLVSNKYLMDHVNEFISPNFHEPLHFKYLLLLLIALLALSRKRLRPSGLILILIFTSMALYSVRHIPLFAMITAPILVCQCEALLNGGNGRFSRFLRKRGERIAAVDAKAGGYIWPVAGVLIVVFCAAWGRIEHKFDPKIKPVAAVEFIKREPIKGNMFNNDEFGDYIIYAAWPDYRVFFDGRSDMYGVDIMKEYFKVANVEPDWEKVLAKYQINWIMFDAKSVLSRFLLVNNGWRLIYGDKLTNIFVRNIPANQALISKYRNVTPVPQDAGDDKEKRD